MTIITITSDFGQKDHYTAVIKGAILCQNPNSTFVDISHNVKTYDIVQAAYILKGVFADFPEKTIHIACVNNLQSTENRFVAVAYKNHYFIAPDNGLLSMVMDEAPEWIYEIPYEGSAEFVLKDIFAKACHYIISGEDMAQLGPRHEGLQERISLRPVVNANQIRGTVIYIDHFENVVLNIDRKLFERVSAGRPFQLFFKRHDPITRLSESYNDVPIGVPLCLFNYNDHLEIAINMGKASTMLGLNKDDAIQIDFA